MSNDLASRNVAGNLIHQLNSFDSQYFSLDSTRRLYEKDLEDRKLNLEQTSEQIMFEIQKLRCTDFAYRLPDIIKGPRPLTIGDPNVDRWGRITAADLEDSPWNGWSGTPHPGDIRTEPPSSEYSASPFIPPSSPIIRPQNPSPQPSSAEYVTSPEEQPLPTPAPSKKALRKRGTILVVRAGLPTNFTSGGHRSGATAVPPSPDAPHKHDPLSPNHEIPFEYPSNRFSPCFTCNEQGHCKAHCSRFIC